MIKITFLFLLTFSLSAYADTSPTGQDLIAAVQAKNLSQVQAILQAGVDANYTDPNDPCRNYGGTQSSALAAAHTAQALDILQALLNAKASPDSLISKPSYNCILLIQDATQQRNVVEVKSLIAAHASVTYSWPLPSLVWTATQAKQTALVQVLVQAGADASSAFTGSQQTSSSAPLVAPLGLAISQNDMATVEVLLDANVEVNNTAPDQVSALYYAAKQSNLDLVKTLITHGANPSQIVPMLENTALKAALRNGDMATFNYLLSTSPMLGIIINCDDKTELRIAIETANRVALQELLKAGLSPDLRPYQPDQEKAGGPYCHQASYPPYTLLDDLTPLMFAIQSKQAAIAQDLLTAGATVDKLTSLGQTALMFMAQLGEDADFTPVANALIKLKPNVNLLDAKTTQTGGCTPFCNGSALSYASMSGALTLGKLLLSNGADPNVQDYQSSDGAGYPTNVALGTPLIHAAETGNIPFVTALVNAKANIQAVDAYNRNALLLSAGLNSDQFIPLFKYLTGAGIAAASKDVFGMDLLHLIFILNPTTTGNELKIPVLLNAKLDVNSATPAGSTPLMYAAGLDGKTFPPSVVALLKAHANPTLKNEENKTAVDFARAAGDSASVSAICAATPGGCTQ